ncbi:MAG TPA: protein kinase [Planctomycetota bacterium]|nr:protein kinase [Planctomycetota bacterium]
MAKLVIKNGRHAGAEYKLTSGRMVMGRRSACAIPIPDEKASREHAAIIEKNGQFVVQDLSRNGTLVNGRPASKTEEGTPLNFGDRIKIGDTEMELIDEKIVEESTANIDIPGYTILDRIGAGGMGTVYKAKQISMDRVVALKILNERYSSNSEFVDRFIREARAAGKLNHPHVIHVHDISRANGRHYFSMEYVDGPSVKELLKLEKKIDVNRALDITLQTAKALEFAHENKIVHRDVKPDNIMLTKEGIVKLADLGIAKTFEEGAASAKEARRVMGTPHYMAPEQALGKPIDHRVDIYSLGATFYHMVTGTTPFAGATAHEILKAHIQQSLPAIQELNPKVPDPVCFIIERMMAKLPEKRYGDMTRLIADIERVQKGVIAGIDRIEAGDSTIMRAVKDGGKAPDKKKEVDSEEAPTGEQKKIPAPVMALALAAVFILVVAAVIFIAQQFKPQETGTATNTTQQTTDPGTGTVATPGINRSHAEAKKLLEAALAAQNANDPSEYVGKLEEIRSKYPTSLEADEAIKLLDQYAAASKEADKKKAETLISEAKALETSGKLAESIAKYKAAADAAKNFPEISEPAKTAQANLQKKLDAETAKTIEDAYRGAMDTASSARTKQDYDAARAALQGFLGKYDNAPQKNDIQTALDKVNAEAAAKYKEVETAVTQMDIPAALAAWDQYTTRVKDSTKADDVKAAKENLEGRADQFATEELTRSSEKAKKYDFLEALNIANGVVKKLAGIKKWEDIAKQKADSIRRQKDLHNKFLTSAAEKLKGGPVAVPFFVVPQFANVKWKASKVSGEQISLDAVPVTAAPGLMKRMSELPPKDQYEFYMLFLPKEQSADDHKALAAFCAERGMGPEAQNHELKAGSGQ